MMDRPKDDWCLVCGASLDALEVTAFSDLARGMEVYLMRCPSIDPTHTNFSKEVEPWSYREMLTR